MNNKNSAIFLAAVLLVGIIGMASPLIGSASANEEKYKEKRHDSYDYKKDRNYDSYDSHDYKKDRDYGSDYEKDYKKDNSYGSDYEKDYKKDMSYGSDYEKDYKKEKKYDSYDPYAKDNKYDGKYYSGFKCNANNFNINTANSKSIEKNIGADATGNSLSTQQLSELATPQTLGSIFGGGFSLEVKNICINFGDNDFSGFVGTPR
ncbi:MAG TPA: hypothetical protein VFK40_12810 [Nitrososphaeraceae archaeon]|nr:hypothetical protein [Nitrososphaeraceae archaeon]